MWMLSVRALASRASLCRAATLSLPIRPALAVTIPTTSAPATARPFSSHGPPQNAKPIDRNRILETPLVEKADNELMRWVGRGAVTQMYCTFLFAGKLIYDADSTANIYEVWAASSAMSSASACVFFGAKMLCDKIVTDIASCRNFGDKGEFVRLTVQGALEKYALFVSLDDIQLLENSSPDKYSFKIGERNFSLDVSKAKCTNRKALENLLQGKPLVTRKTKQPKKRQ